MSAKIVRLQSGEELVATAKIVGTTVTLTDITILLPTQQGSIQLAPFMPYADMKKGLELDRRDVLFITDPQKDLADHHAEIFSQIYAPEKKIIV